MNAGERVTEWAGGTLNELMSVLSGTALPSRIQVFGPVANSPLVGEVHLLAGGLSDAFFKDQRGQDALVSLQRVTGTRFVVDTRLPDPKTGSLSTPGPGNGNLATRPLAELMRYCEEYVLTCTLEVSRREEHASISYRRGELVGTKVGGSDAEEQLPSVMAWKEGFYEIHLPPPMMPPVPAPSKRNTGTSPAVGAAVPGPTRPSPGDRRKETDPFISVKSIQPRTPPRAPGPPARPEVEKAPVSRLPPGPPLPGLQNRAWPHPVAAGHRVQSHAGAITIPSGPETPAPPRNPDSVFSSAETPIASQSVVTQEIGRIPRTAAAITDSSPMSGAGPGITPLSRAATPRDRDATPPPKAPFAGPADITVRKKVPASAPPPVQSKSSIQTQPTAPIRTRARPPLPPAIRGAASAAAHMPPSVGNRTSGEIRQSPTPVRGVDIRASEVDLPMVDSRSSGVHVADEMRDPAAYVVTPAPHLNGARHSPPMSTPTPIATTRHAPDRSSDRLSAFTSVQSDDMAADLDAPSARPGKRTARIKETSWTLVVLVGILVGIVTVVAYSAYFGLPLKLP